MVGFLDNSIRPLPQVFVELILPDLSVVEALELSTSIDRVRWHLGPVSLGKGNDIATGVGSLAASGCVV
jgi:hypothetical protein